MGPNFDQCRSKTWLTEYEKANKRDPRPSAAGLSEYMLMLASLIQTCTQTLEGIGRDDAPIVSYNKNKNDYGSH